MAFLFIRHFYKGVAQMIWHMNHDLINNLVIFVCIFAHKK